MPRCLGFFLVPCFGISNDPRPRAAGVGLALLTALSLAAACSPVGPDAEPPRVTVPEAWSTPAGALSPSPGTETGGRLSRWWTIFQDPGLSALVERSLADNLDARLAEARIRQARAVRAGAGSALGPTLDSTVSGRRTRTPPSTSSGDDGQSSLFQAGFDASWELDLFGRVRRGVEAADADLAAAREARRDVDVSIAAEAARGCFAVRAQTRRIDLARRTLAAHERTVALTRQRFEAGIANGLDLAGAEAQAASAAASIDPLEVDLARERHALAVLLGQDPGATIPECGDEPLLPMGLPAVPLGVPSDLLRRRPDIRRAEAQIDAATARIGIAKADLFPRLTLSGSLDFQSSAVDPWFVWANRLWSIGPAVSWRAVDSGKAKAAIEQQEALRDQTLIGYQQVVLAALREVEDALVAATREETRLKNLARVQAEHGRATELAEALHAVGQSDLLSVLQARRSLYGAEDAVAQAARNLAVSLVALCKALGGGWDETGS